MSASELRDSREKALDKDDAVLVDWVDFDIACLHRRMVYFKRLRALDIPPTWIQECPEHQYGSRLKKLLPTRNCNLRFKDRSNGHHLGMLGLCSIDLVQYPMAWVDMISARPLGW